jgi:hypothetical protein
MSTSIPSLVSEPYPDRRTFYLGFFGGIGFVLACLHFAVEWYWCALGIVCFFLVMATLSWQATIDYSQRKVYEQSRLFGRRLIRTVEFPFSDFPAIVYQVRQNDDSPQTVVGLRHRSGRTIWLRHFGMDGSGRGRGAEAFAWRLHCDTDIEIDEKSR